MEYLGATIDMDIDLFLKKVKTAIENLELLDEVGNKKTKAFAKAFNEALSGAKTVNLEDTLSKLMKAKDMLGTFREGMEKLTKYGLFDQPIFTKEDSEHIIEVVSSNTEKTIKMLEDMIEKAVEAKRTAFNKLQDDKNKIPHVSTQQDAMALAQAEKLKAQPKQNGDKSEVVNEINNVKEAQDELKKSTDEATKANEKNAESFQEIIDTEDDAEKAANDASKANKELLNSFNVLHPVSDKLNEKTRNFIETLDDLAKSAITLSQSGNLDLKDMGNSLLSLMGELKDGKISLRDFKKSFSEIQDASRRIGASELSAKSRKQLRVLNAELDITQKRLKKIVFEGGRTEKSMSTTANLLTRMASKLLPQKYRYILMTLRNSFGYLSIGIAGVGAALLGAISYIKMFYQWNKRLIGLKWGDLKDRIKVMSGYMTKEDAITASVKRRTEVIREETQALIENMEAQRSATTAMDRATASYDRTLARQEAKNNIINDQRFSFLGEGKPVLGDEFYKSILDNENAKMGNVEAIKEFLDASDEEIARWTDEEFKKKKLAFEQALMRHRALYDSGIKRLELMYKSEVMKINLGLDDLNAEGEHESEDDENLTKEEKLQKTKEHFEKLREIYLNGYKDILNEQKKFNDELEKWSEKTDKVRLSERAKNAQQRIDVLDMPEIGNDEWTGAQQEKDDVSEMMRKRNDYREYELWLIKRKADLQKKAIDISGQENAQTKKLGIEVQSLAKQLERLKSFGLNSDIHNRLIEDTEKELMLKTIEHENSAYEDQVRELERILSLRKQENELKGFDGFDVENANLEIKTMEQRINGLLEQKYISEEERKEVDKLLVELEKLIDARDRLARQKFEIEVNHKLDLKKQDLELEADEVNLGVGMEGKDSVYMQERLLDINVQLSKVEYERAETKLKELEAQKKLAEENEREGIDGVKWTEAENKEYQKQKALVDKLRVAIEKMNDAKERGVEKENIADITRKADLEVRKIENRAKINKFYTARVGRSQAEIDIKDLELQISKTEEEYKAQKKVVDLIEKRKELAKKEDASDEDKKKWNDAVDNKVLEEEIQKLEDLGVSWEEAKDALLEYFAELKNKSAMFGEIANGLHEIADIVEDNLGENAFSNVVEGLGNVGDAMSSIADMKMNGVSYADKANAWMQAAQFVAGQVSGILATQKRIRESAEAWKQAIADVAHEYTMLKIEDLEYKQQNLFGVEDPYKKLQDNSNKYMEARKATYETLAKIEGQGVMKVGEVTKEKWDAIMADTLTGLGTGAVAGGVAGAGVFSWAGAAIGGAIGAATGFLTGLFKEQEVVDVFDTLKNKFGEVFDPDTLEINKEILASYDLLDDKTKKLIDDYKELKDKQDEAMEDFKEFAKEMFGDIGIELSKQLQSAFRNGDLYSSVKDFTAFVKSQIENIISQKIFNSVFGQLFDGINKRIEDSIEHGGANIEDILSNIPYQTEELIGKYGVLMQKVQESMDEWDLFSPEEATQEAMKGKISSMTEDTASKLNGNFMGLKLSAMEINTKMTAVKNFMEDNNGILSRSLTTLQQIADNTQYCRRLEIIENGLNDIRMNGLKVV